MRSKAFLPCHDAGRGDQRARFAGHVFAGFLLWGGVKLWMFGRARGEREAGRSKEEKNKNLSSPVARPGEEGGGTMSFKTTLFCSFFLFYLCGDQKMGYNSNLHHYYCILPYTHTHTHTYIYRKGWLTTRLSFLIILNLVSEFSAVRTLLFLSFLQPTFSLPLLNGLYSRCSRLLPHHRWCSPADQPSTSYCRWCSSSTTAAYPCWTSQWLLIASFFHSSTHYGHINSSYRSSLKHPPSCFVET